MLYICRLSFSHFMDFIHKHGSSPYQLRSHFHIYSLYIRTFLTCKSLTADFILPKFVFRNDIIKFLSNVNSDSKYYEPDHWKFGTEGNNYFRHATRQLFAVTRDLATYISANRWVSMMVCNPIDQTDQLFISYFLNTTFRHILHKYSNEDVSFGSWLIGLEVEHVDERSLCCGTPPGWRLHLHPNFNASSVFTPVASS